jgi:hypothetical protein
LVREPRCPAVLGRLAMKFTAEQVRALIDPEKLSRLSVKDVAFGVQLECSGESGSDGEYFLDAVLQAALALKLDHRQVKSNIRLSGSDYYGGEMDIDVTFLWDVPTGGDGV